MEFQKPLEQDIKFGLLYKVTPTNGNLAWEYNPFRNYRLSEPKFYFRDKYFSSEELQKELGVDLQNLIQTLKEKKRIQENVNSWEELLNALTDWTIFYRNSDYSKYVSNPIANEDDPVLYDTNQLIDFDTDELNFSVNNPVDILPQWSYDGSVNLIINDGKNSPKLINSRFSPLGRNKYKVVDRKGNNDTNIYDQGDQFQSDTSLYKTYVGIPKLEFINVYQGGNMSVGNYHFYFRFCDADGNETDFVAESGLVSIFKGTSLTSITY